MFISEDTYLEKEIIDDNEIDNFLEHHGVKGQKWGVRNLKQRTGAFIKRHKKGIEIGAGAVAAAGAIAAASILRHNANVKWRAAQAISRQNSNHLIWVNQVLASKNNLKVSKIGRLAKNPNISPERISKLQDVIAKNYVNKALEARKRYPIG